MINASKEFKEKVNSNANLINYADITLNDGTVLNLTYKDFMIGGCRISDSTTDGNEFSAGNAIGKSINLRIANHDERYSKYDFYKAVIWLYIGMLLDNGTVEKIRKGKYYVNVPESPGDVINIEAVDSMVLFDRPYAESVAYPATLQTILADACTACGVRIGFGQFDNYSFMVNQKPEGVTYRQIVSFVSQIAGYNARINNDDALELVWYNTALLDEENYDGGLYKDADHGNVVDGGLFTDKNQLDIIDGGLFTDAAVFNIYSFKSFTVATDDVVITGVKILNDEKEYIFGDAGYAITIEGNPFVTGKEQEVANYLGMRMVGMRFRPFTGQIRGNPLYEPFDVGYVTDRKGNIYRTVINSVEFTIGSYMTISCQAESPLRNSSSYRSEAARAVVEARRDTEKKLSNYDIIVQQMNELAGNAMGFHTTYEELPDGSRITYLHDKPDLKNSVTVYKQSIDGFFLSTDGGKTYTAGFDKNGNAVVNILAAIGIMFDWAKGGTLTLGGDSNIDGSCVVYDATGKEVARLDKDGLTTNSARITGGVINIRTSDEEVSSITLNSENFTVGLSSSSISFNTKSMLCSFGWNGLFFSSNNYHSSTSFKLGNTLINATGIEFGNNISLKQSSAEILGWKFSTDSFRNNADTYIFSSTACWIKKSVYIGASNQIAFSSDGTFNFSTSGNLMASNAAFYTRLINTKTLCVNGIYVTGTKSRIAKTKNYSDRLLYCYETPKPYFGDIGEAILDEDGLCYVFLDDVFYETVNTDCSYQVFLQKYGQGDIWVKARTPTYFVVVGTPNLPFGWEVKARQLGFESERLETYEKPVEEQTIDYEQEAQNYIDNYYKEMLTL